MVLRWSSVCWTVRLAYIHLYFHFWAITSKYQLIFTKLVMCIDIVEIWFEIANRQIASILDSVTDHDTSIFPFQDNNLSKSLNLICAN